MMDAHRENVLALIGLIDATEDEAAEKLATRVTLTVGTRPAAQLFAHDLAALLGRSLSIVTEGPCEIEVAVGRAFNTTAEVRVAVNLTSAALSMGSGALTADIADDVPGLFRKIAACYAAGNIISRAVRGERFEQLLDPFIVDFSAFGVTAEELARVIELEEAVLVGAGGVGNGFMWAAQELNLSGHLTIADPKVIGKGALNRCLFFGEGDLGQPKAAILAERAIRPGLVVDSFVGKFGDLRAERSRVKRVITTPDSREVRRSIQSELPLEVLDASTTDSSEVIVHSHRQPAKGACLACVYPHIEVEDQRAKHVAEGLGLTVEEIKRQFIDEEIAKKLYALHPSLVGVKLVGQAFDTIYKQQCGIDALLTAAGQQAAAPLAFISNLAGALLALELVRFDAHPDQGDSLYQALSPWHPPFARARRVRDRLPQCEFCSKEESEKIMKVVWPEIAWPE